METVLIFIVGWLSALSGVAVGAYAVFRTKRDPHESFFGSSGKGEAFNLDDDFSIDNVSVKTTLPKPTEKANENFINQFAENLPGKVEK